MRKQIFKALCERIKKEVPKIKYIDLWNNNIEEINGGKTWLTPAVFIEFETIEWRQQGKRTKMGDIAVRLHIITRAIANSGHGDHRLEEAMSYFDLIDEVNVAVQNLNGANFATFQHTTSATNHNHAELVESVERFITRAQDITAVSTTAVSTEVGEVKIQA